jgi:hypothetical protein
MTLIQLQYEICSWSQNFKWWIRSKMKGCATVFLLSHYVVISMDCIQNTDSQLLHCCMLWSCCLATSMFAELFCRNDCLCWHNSSCLEQICHTDPSLMLPVLSRLWHTTHFLFFELVQAKLPRVSSAPTYLTLQLWVVCSFAWIVAGSSIMPLHPFFAAWWKTWLLASRSPVHESTWLSCWIPSCFLDIATLSGLGWPCHSSGSHWLPTVVDRVWVQVRSWGICGGQSGIRRGFLQVLQFPLPILIPSNAPHSSPIIWGWYNRPDSGQHTK